jgi:hypothetical protein
MHGPDIIILFLFVGIPWTLGWISKSYWNHQQFMKVLQLKAEMNNKLLDRAGADPALLDFLKSDAQQQLFEVKLPEPRLPAAYMRMLTAIQLSFLFLAAGIALLVVRSNVSYQGDQVTMLFFGTLSVALGIGSMLSAVAAFTVGRLWHGMTRADAGARS